MMKILYYIDMLIYILSLTAALLILLTLITTTIYISWLIISWFYGAPYVPTRDQDIQSMIEKLHITKNAKMIELGCGDGRVIRMFAKKYGIRGVGYDINPIVLGIARLKAWIEKADLTFSKKDIRSIDFSDADIIYIFLFPKLIHELKSQIMKAKKDAMIISHGFKIPYLEKNLKDVYEDGKFKTYIYKAT